MLGAGKQATGKKRRNPRIKDFAPVKAATGLGLKLANSLYDACPGQDQHEIEIRKKLGALRTAAVRPMSELRGLGINERRMLLWLWGTWLACRSKPESLSTISDLPLAKLKALPAALGTLAKTLESINKHTSRLTTNQIAILLLSPRLQGRYMALTRLPMFLRMYAHDLSIRLENHPSKALAPGTDWKVQTVEFVRENSKDSGQHYQLVANLMKAFNETEDKKQLKKSKKVTAASLKQLWLTYSDLRKPQTFPTFAPLAEPIGRKILAPWEAE
jgi:hypothetical protein